MEHSNIHLKTCYKHSFKNPFKLTINFNTSVKYPCNKYYKGAKISKNWKKILPSNFKVTAYLYEMATSHYCNANIDCYQVNSEVSWKHSSTKAVPPLQSGFPHRDVFRRSKVDLLCACTDRATWQGYDVWVVE